MTSQYKIKLQLDFVGFGVYDEIYMQRIQKRKDLYKKIDWKKATSLFYDVPSQIKKHKRTSTREILAALAKFADDGIKFMVHADDPAIVEYALLGTGPLNWETKHVITRFKKQRYATVEESRDGVLTVKITKRGMIRALSYKLDTLSLDKRNQWDKKWRVVIFDIPDMYKHFRDLFRKRLIQLGLYQLQESVYVSPYSCFEEIEFLRELYGIAFTVRYLLVEKIEEDSNIRTHFNL